MPPRRRKFAAIREAVKVRSWRVWLLRQHTLYLAKVQALDARSAKRAAIGSTNSYPF
jgi:hypothetical protein